MALPVAEREIHNGHDLWAELLRILFSVPSFGLGSKNRDPGDSRAIGAQGKGGWPGRRQPHGVSTSHTRRDRQEWVCWPPAGIRYTLATEWYRVCIQVYWLCDLRQGA